MPETLVISTPARILRNIRFQSLSQGYGALVSLLLPVLIVRLGMEDWAIYVLGAVIFAIVRVVSDLGVGTLAIRDVAQQPDRLAGYQRAQLAIRWRTTTICLLAMIGAGAAVGGPHTLPVVALFGAAMWLEAMAEGYRWIFRARQQMGRDALAGTIERTSTLAFTIVAVFLLHSIEACAGAFAAGQLLNLVAARALARELLPPGPAVVDPDTRRLMLRLGPTFVLMAGTWTLYNNVDRVILWAVPSVPRADVGLYGLAYMPLKGLLMIPEVVMMSLFPALAELHATDPERLRATVRSVFRYLAGGTLLSATALAVMERSMASLLLVLHRKDESTGLLGPLLCVLVLSAPLYSVTSISGHVLAASGRQIRLTVWYLLALGFNVAGNVAVAIPALGVMGCALMTVATEVLLSFALVLNLPRPLSRMLLPRTLAVTGTVLVVLSWLGPFGAG